MNTNNNDDVNKIEKGNLELNSFLVTSLIYPMNLVNNLGYKDHWFYKDETIETLGRTIMMDNAVFASKEMSVSATNGERHYFAHIIKNNFIKIFGPDTSYFDENFGNKCNFFKYDGEKNIYIEQIGGCGGATNSWIDAVSKKYKAEQIGDYVYIYEYVQPVWIGPEDTNNWQSPTVIYLVDKNYEKTTLLEGATESNYESIIEQMMDKGEVDTYKWTFKKQSDGKYYFYSGAWEN